MKQIIIPKIGKPTVLTVRETPDPKPKKGEVLIRVKAAGINFADILARVGLYPDAPKLPTVVGYEVSGVVESLGAGVRMKKGTRVVALTRFGGYSSAICVPGAQVLKIPDSLSFQKAAAIPVNYLTAWLMLINLGNVQKGDRVLIHAVAGGVGQAAVQICKWRGAKIFGTASSKKHARLKKSGVHHCIDYTKKDFEKVIKRLTKGEGVDIVLDAVGGKSFKKSYRSLNPLGRLFMFGISSFNPKMKRSIPTAIKGLMQMPTFRPIRLMNDNRGVFGVNLGHLWDKEDIIQDAFRNILNLTAKGTFKPVVDKAFPFEKAAEAHTYIQERRNFGKVLLIPD